MSISPLAPHDIRLEQEIIGTMLFDPVCIADVVEIVQPQHFYYTKYQGLVREIYHLWQKDEQYVNIVELEPFLTKHDLSISDMVDIVANTITTANVVYHATRLRDLASLRNLVRIGQDLASMGYMRGREEIREAINQAERRISEVTNSTVEEGTLSPLSDALLRYAGNLEEKYAAGSPIVGIPSGFQDLDHMLTGFKKQELIILAARPSMGKTALAIDLAMGMAESGHKTLFFELEMSEESIVNRIVANGAGLDSSQLGTGLLSDEEYEQYTKALGYLYEKLGSTLFLETAPSIDITTMKAKARKIKKDQGLDMIFIDYLGLMGTDRNMNRYEAVSENVRAIKQMARELDVPVICLCQLSRQVEQREDKRPMLSDLRESGEIEQTADIVAFLYRDDYYDGDSEKKNITEILVSKHRNGAIGKTELLFVKEQSKFLDLSRREHAS
ncbi:replicative DNA helicase [Thermoactinomyces sp. DSM 45892]|uniref:replicative DNA helicase n=1 Tax=Thermoactinomyces sp. DSM 45892 TaxID=1882753 RepID=UPI000899CA25|nr:replicative DNA helicase [Thermoactinomyces sp. DSM 45892]SDZ00271.1 replicative DNA helicase [Thermoactinomyces sp. DSM 45892]